MMSRFNTSSRNAARFSALSGGLVRALTQTLVMKPYIWSALRVTVHGKNNLENLKAPFIAIGNHSSHLDTCLVMGALPKRLSKNLAPGAAADYFFDRWYKSASTRLLFNIFPVERKGLRKRKSLAGLLLDHGVPLLIFPEGTRTRNGGMTEFKPGAAALSISHKVPILPFALVGAYAAMPFGTNVPAQGRPEVHVVFGRSLRANPNEGAVAFSARLHRYITELHDGVAVAHNMPTQSDFLRAEALRSAAITQTANSAEENLDFTQSWAQVQAKITDTAPA